MRAKGGLIHYSTHHSIPIHENYVYFEVRQSCALFTGYDKMKSFGFPIHAAEDGYSRKVLWVKTEMSNNLPEVQVIT